MTDDFLDRPTTRAGTLGERIARRLLEAKNYMVYTPDELDGAHPIDIVAINKDRLVALLCDVKAKPRRVHWPDTGIDMRHWLKYQCLGITHNVRVFLIFVDWEAGEVYGGFLDELERQREVKTGKGRFWYPRTENYGRSEIRYFPLAAMHKVGTLMPDEASDLKQLSRRDEAYNSGKQLPLLYDGPKDLARSISEGFRAIRERMANGGPGWEPK
jgi:hypothetical protein